MGEEPNREREKDTERERERERYSVAAISVVLFPLDLSKSIPRSVLSSSNKSLGSRERERER